MASLCLSRVVRPAMLEATAAGAAYAAGGLLSVSRVLVICPVLAVLLIFAPYPSREGHDRQLRMGVLVSVNLWTVISSAMCTGAGLAVGYWPSLEALQKSVAAGQKKVRSRSHCVCVLRISLPF